MKRLLVILLISSIFLTQCYTQNEYMFKDYRFSDGGELKKIILVEGTIIEFTDKQCSYEMKSDALIIKRRTGEEPFGDHLRIRINSDTLKAEDIRAVFVSELEIVSTVTLGLFVGSGLILLLMKASVFGEFGFGGFDN